MTDTPPPVPIDTRRTPVIEAVSVVWLVPLIALIAAGVIAWLAYAERGPLIEIRFETASGIQSGQTELRFRDVAVGVVEEVTFTDALAEVSVFVRVDQAVASYIDDESEFWIVQPRVTAQGISGLETVLSGVYLEGLWDNVPGPAQSVFQGLPEAPLGAFEGRGLRIELRATGDTELTERIPILYRGIEVGRMGRARISRDGSAVFADAIIFQPYDELVTTSTRFWDTSGVRFSLGAGGAQIDFGSIASIVTGGITFDTLVSGAEPVRDGVVFQVYADETAARASVFNESDDEPLRLTVIFQDNIAGLAVGAPVELGGVRIGEVTNLTGVVDPQEFGDSRVRLQTSLSILPSRLGLPGEVTPGTALDFLETRVTDGLRARLANAGILTGGLKVEFVLDAAAPQAALDRTTQPFPTFPSTENEVTDLTATAEGVLQRVGNLPIEELLENAIIFLDTATALVGSDDIKAVPGEALALLEDARGVVGSESAQAIPEALASALAEIDALITALNEQDASTKLLAAFAALELAAGDFGTAIEGVPDLLGQIDAVAEKAEALELEDLVAELTGLADSANAVIGTEAARAVPAQLSGSLEELGTLLTDLNEQKTAEQLLTAFAAVELAAADFGTAIEGMPQVIERIDAVAAMAEELPLDALAEELTGLVASAEEVVGTEAAKELPESLGAALDELALVLTDLREGGATENLNQTLASARTAADSIAASAEDLPAVIERLNGTLAQANATLSSFDRNSDVNRDARAALRAVQAAAEDVSSLARAIERQPNSLITGR